MKGRRTVYEIPVPFRRPLETVAGTIGERRSVILAVDVDGVTGWAEAPAFPSGRAGSATDAFDDLASGADPTIPIAVAALQGAHADAESRAADTPLHRHLGGTDDPVLARHPLGLTDPDTAEVELEWIGGLGISAVKLKITPGRDRGVVARLRERSPELDIGVDGNGSYTTPGDLIWLDDFGVSFIEQPFPADDLTGHAALRERISTPVCLDESVSSPDSVAKALSAGAADQVAVKVNRVGLDALHTIVDLCADAEVAVRIGGTFDTSLGRRHVLAAATLPPVIDAEAGPPSAYLAADIVGYPAVVDGRITPDVTPGIGVEPDRDRLTAMAVRMATV